MSHPWNVCHYWESTDLALNFGATRFLSLKKLEFLRTGTGFRYCHFAVTSLWMLTVFPFHFHVVHFGFPWHLFRFDVTLPFFGFLPQSRYLVRLLLCLVWTHEHTSTYPFSAFTLGGWYFSEPHFLLFPSVWSLLSSMMLFCSLTHLQLTTFSVFHWLALFSVPVEILSGPKTPGHSSLGCFSLRSSSCWLSAHIILSSLSAMPPLCAEGGAHSFGTDMNPCQHSWPQAVNRLPLPGEEVPESRFGNS